MTRNTLVTTMLLAALGGLFVLGGYALTGTIGGASIGLVLGLVIAGGSYWFSDTLAIRAARAVPATREQQPPLYAIVEELSTAAQLPMPRLYISPSPQPNAFATGRAAATTPMNVDPAHATAYIVDPLTWAHGKVALASLLADHPPIADRVARLVAYDDRIDEPTAHSTSA